MENKIRVANKLYGCRRTLKTLYGVEGYKARVQRYKDHLSEIVKRQSCGEIEALIIALKEPAPDSVLPEDRGQAPSTWFQAAVVEILEDSHNDRL